MEFLIRKMILELRDNKVHAEDLIELLDWINSPEFGEHVEQIMSQLDCCEKAAIETAVAAKLMSFMRPLKQAVNQTTYNRVAKLADDFASWLLELKNLENAKFILAFHYDKQTGDMDKRPGKYTEHHYEIFSDDDEDLDYEDDDSALADDES